MHVTIHYKLSEQGRKASILAGGDGKAEQAVIVEHGTEHFAAALAQADVGHDGTATLRLFMWYDPKFDAPPPIEELLSVRPAQAAAKAAEEVAAALARHDATLTVLTDRKITVETKSVGDVTVEYHFAAWPYNPDQTVTQSPAAQAWELELQQQRQAAQHTYDAALATKTAADKAASDARKAAKELWRSTHGLDDNDMAIAIEDGCLTTAPCYENHKRGKNWLATITSNPKAPGGLERDFAAKCRGDLYYQLPAWSTGDAVEFGADYYSSGGRKNSNRWYGYYVRAFQSTTESPSGRPVGTTYVVLRECASGKDAIKAGKQIA